MACLPLLCCLVYLGAQGRSIREVYLPLCEWNDELFYYKQVEGIVHFGYPLGYFGFNESHALKLSFAAWSPVLVFPWILWGLLFGWNLLSPIICNIVLLTLAVFLFVWLVRPTWRQLGVSALLFCLYRPFVRYMLSGMPEIICFSMLILFYGLAYNELHKERFYKLVLLFVLAGVMTLMRPYLLLFLLLPVFLCMKKYKGKGFLLSAGVLAVVLSAYGLIKHYLGAEYFAPLFFTDWITTFFEKGFGAGVRNLLGTLYRMGSAFMGHTIEGFRSGLASGAFFGGYLVMMAVLIGQSVADYRVCRRARKNAAKENAEDAVQDSAEPALDSGKTGGKGLEKLSELQAQLVIEAHLAFCFVGMLFALLLMYKLTEGSKHLLTFMAAGIFVIGQMRTRTFKKTVLVGAVFAYLYSYKAVNPYDYQVPFVEDKALEQMAYWEQVYAEELSLDREQVPNYDNVVIWVFHDELETGYENTKWQMLYGLPEGFGVSCCMPDYCIEHLNELQSRYLTVVSGGRIDALCREAGWRELGRDQDLVLYEQER